MNRKWRALAREVFPLRITIPLWRSYCLMKARKARRFFNRASSDPAWLGEKELEELQTRYPLGPLDYGYDPQSIEKRSWERARHLMRIAARRSQPVTDFLDMGCWDGMICHALEQFGKKAIGIDVCSDKFAHEAVAGGIQLMQMNAEKLSFPSGLFDMVFSYNAFEHISNPEAALQEALRVVRPGGYIYLSFGPLYFSHKGAHQFHAISVPYCQHLFKDGTLSAFAEKRGLSLNDFGLMNKWPVKQFRRLWKKYGDVLETIEYYETYHADHVDLIARYPTCFKSKTDDFDELMVAHIEVLFRKKR